MQRTMLDVPLVELSCELLLEFLNVHLYLVQVGVCFRRVDGVLVA